MSLTCGFIGLGLIGGSIAKALKAVDPSTRIIAYTASGTTAFEAKEEGVVDVALTEINETFSQCDYIFLCAPVKFNNDNLRTLLPFLNPATTVTDIGSVKTDIHRIVKELGLEKQFIGGHPMAGSERIGFANSKVTLLENAYYILTKTPETQEDRLQRYYELVKSIGALPLVVTYQQHDYITAAVSHVPHVISASLVNLIRDNDSPDALMKTIAAGGFKDITRISSSSPVMWQQICLTNGENISTLLDSYITSLQRIKGAIDRGDADALYSFFDGARTYRDSFNNLSSGPLKKVYVLHLEIDDQPGNIARVAALLADNELNIKNIGIVHNREYERGTLRVEFHDENSMKDAETILRQNGYVLEEM